LSACFLLFHLAAGALIYAKSPQRERGNRADSKTEIARLLQLQEGSVVADIGAGDGEYTLDLARRVGSQGKVFSTEVDRAKLRKIRKKLDRSKLQNVTIVEGSDTDTGLETGSCDAIFLRLVYHHFSDPEAMMSSMLKALKPDGLVAIIEFTPKRRHGIKPEKVMGGMLDSGFELVERIDMWGGRGDYFCMIFKPAAQDTSSQQN